MSDGPNVIELATKKFTPEEIGVTISPTFRFTCEVHCPTKNLSYADQVFMIDKCVFRDYEDNFADVIELSLSFPMGTFLYDVYDHLENIDITVKQLTQFYKAAASKTDTSPHVRTTRYKAVFLKDKNKTLPTSRAMARSDLNQQLPIVVVFQLIEKPADAIRIKTTGGSFSKGTGGVAPEPFLRGVFSEELNRIKVDGQPAVDVFDIAKFDNTEKIKHLLIPSHKRLVELPDYLQEKLGGIYNDGLSCYVQFVMSKPGEYKSTLSIFNLYNPDREGSADSLIYCVNNGAKTINLVGGIHDKSGQGIHLLAHRLTGIEDGKTTKALDRGTGFRVADATKIMEEPIKYKAGGGSFNRNSSATEVIGQDRDDGINFATNHHIGHNNLALTADVFKRMSVYVTVQVSNLDHTLLAPNKKYELNYLSTQPDPDGGGTKKMVRRYAYVLQVMSAYTSNNHDLIKNNNSMYVELTNHTTLKMVVGEILNP